MSACQCSTAYTPSRNALYRCAQVYYVAKQCNQKCSAEEYAIALAKNFVSTYPGVSACCMSICCVQKVHAPLMMGAASGCGVRGMVHKHTALRLAAADRTGVEGEDLGGAEALEADDSGRRAARPWCAAATPVQGLLREPCLMEAGIEMHGADVQGTLCLARRSAPHM